MAKKEFLIRSTELPLHQLIHALNISQNNIKSTDGNEQNLEITMANSVYSFNDDFNFRTKEGEVQIKKGEEFLVMQLEVDDNIRDIYNIPETSSSSLMIDIKANFPYDISKTLKIYDTNDLHNQALKKFVQTTDYTEYQSTQEMIRALNSKNEAVPEDHIGRKDKSSDHSNLITDKKEEKGAIQQPKEMNLDKVEELLNVLIDLNKNKEGQQISLLLDQIHHMEKNYLSVLQELNEAKVQLNMQGMNQAGTGNRVYSSLTNNIASDVKTHYESLQKMGLKINEKCHTILQNFKDIGVKAFNNVCSFLGIKENLVELRDMAQSDANKMQSALDKVAQVSTEVGDTITHARNIGRSIQGKELLNPDNQKEMALFSSLKSYYQGKLDSYTARVEKLDQSINKFNKLEQYADKISKKPSVREKLQNYAEKAQDSSTEQRVKEKQHTPEL